MGTEINKTLVAHIYSALKEKIVGLELSFGQRIDLKIISSEFGVSQTPIRDALNRLARDGLVTENPRKGFYVVSLTPEDMEEIYDLRALIECYALRQGFENIDRYKLEEIYNLAIRPLPISPKKPPEFRDVDNAIHMMIVENCRNKQLNRLYQQLYPLVEISQQLDPLYDRSMQEHVQLIESILNHDLQAALNILERHIENCKMDGIKALQRYLKTEEVVITQ